MESIQGMHVVSGIAIGRLAFYKKPERRIDHTPALDPAAELARMETARAAAIAQQQALYQKALQEAGEEIADVFNVHAMMLEDDDFVDAIRTNIQEKRMRAEYAVKTAGRAMADLFGAIEDEYLRARMADVLDVAQGLIDTLQGATASIQTGEPAILAAEDLSPSETVRLNKALLLGFITRGGSAISHTAILARSMDIPAVVRSQKLDPAWDGKLAILDGTNGTLILDPDGETLVHYRALQEEEGLHKLLLKQMKGLANETRDGRRIELWANIGGIEDLPAVAQNDAGGIGLFRSEFVYLGRQTPPDEETQFRYYRQAVETMAPRRVVIRTCDLGADKTVDYLSLGHEENPALGFRAIRICLTKKEFFKTQLRALLRAAAYGNLGILLPMITSTAEVKAVRALLEACRAELVQEGTRVGKAELGVMIETPAAALTADELAQEVSFFSIGTNDLTQYTCALDRQNALLAPFSDAHHPAVLREIKMAVEAGHRHGISVAICGELGSDPALTETFLRMGVDELSVNPAAILPLRSAIREMDLRRGSTQKMP
ncbi:MAG: phosphoenolpyruvate--protein phosphotransferase [Faecalibacterium sp.]|jgi:phosphotransferase system enzyme I (PtsI)|nr:phosphoenolpyruvate--protein phosphotransferase [Faecalibacterium sp.]